MTEQEINRKILDAQWKVWERESKRLLKAWHNEPLNETQLYYNDIPKHSKEAKMSYKELIEKNIIGPNAVYSVERKLLRAKRKAEEKVLNLTDRL